MRSDIQDLSGEICQGGRWRGLEMRLEAVMTVRKGNILHRAGSRSVRDL